MPTYDYRCRKCGHRFELFHSIKDEKPKRCPRCKGRAERMISSGTGLIFKGTGFYTTDYRSRQYKERAKQEKSGGGGSKGEASGSKGGAGSKGEGGGGGSKAEGRGAKSDGGSKGGSSRSPQGSD